MYTTTRNLTLAIVSLACLASPASAGTITYTWNNTAFHNPGQSYMVVDEAALFRGEILFGDIKSFTFDFVYRAQDLPPDLAIPISTVDAVPLGDSSLDANRSLGGTTYHLNVSFDPGSFDTSASNGGWTSSVDGSFLWGYGYWTTELHIAPEPSGLVLACVGLACVGIASRFRRNGR